MSVMARGKMIVHEVILHSDRVETVSFRCEYDRDDPDDTKFASATPTGNLSLRISNPNLRGKFLPDQKYYVDLTPVESE